MTATIVSNPGVPMLVNVIKCHRHVDGHYVDRQIGTVVFNHQQKPFRNYLSGAYRLEAVAFVTLGDTPE